MEKKERKIHEIANDILLIAQRENYNYESFYDYLNAMLKIESIHDYYGADRASYIIKAFMGNIRYWKCNEIKSLRNELKSIITNFDKN